MPYYLVQYNAAATIRFPMVKRGVVDLAATADWTPAGTDCNISKDGGAQANPANTAAIVTGVTWGITLSAAELTAKEIQLMIVDSATKAVEDQWLIIKTYNNAAAFFQGDITAAALAANLTQVNGNVAGSLQSGVLDVNAKNVNNVAATTDSNQRLKVDVEAWIGNNVQSLQSGVPDVNAKNIGNNTVSNSVAMLGVNIVNINGLASVAAGGFVGIDWGKVTNNGTAVVLNATNIGAVTNNVGNVAGNVGGNVAGSVGTVSGNVNGNVVGAVGTVSGNVNGNVLGSVASVTNLNAQLVDAKITSRAAPGDSMALTAGERTSTADALLNRDMSTGTDSGSGTVRTVRQSLRMLRNKWAANNNVLSVMKEDDVTESWNAALTSDAAAVPITGSDPA